MKKNLCWLLPILIFVVLTPIFSFLDLSIERYFYALGEGNPGHFVQNAFFSFLYDWGPVPAWLLFVVSVVVFALSFFFKKLGAWWRPTLLLILTFAIGAGLITHALLKDHWGRPRPKQVIEFGGAQEFRPYYSPNIMNQPEPSKSFPCGHCTMGFYFFAFAVAAKREGSRKLYVLGMIVAIVFGVVLGVTRMAQGGHFVSDVVAAALVMWLTTLALEHLIYDK
jgi:lipid A 4'-phosphatase